MATKGNQPRILLATGIFYPDVGGPATHVRRIAEAFDARGITVTVVAFGDSPASEPYSVRRVSRRIPKLFSWVLYAATIFYESARHDVVYAFDLTTAGIPAAISAHAFHKPFMLRIGGDPIWERVVEQGKRFMPMRAYYDEGLHRRDRPWLVKIIRHVVNSADRIVTYCDFIADIYKIHYGVNESKISIIRNPFLKLEATVQSEQETFTFIFAGRFVAYKNLPRVINAFLNVARQHREARLLLIGHGPDEAHIRELASAASDIITITENVDQQTLFGKIAHSSVALAPALTEFNPNFILESLSMGKPALISRDNGLSVDLPEEMQFDPMLESSIENAMTNIITPEGYAHARQVVAELPKGETWETVVEKHRQLALKLLTP